MTDRTKDLVGYVIFFCLVILLFFWVFTLFFWEEKQEHEYILNCEAAGGVVLQTSRGFYCMNKELFIIDELKKEK